MGSSENLPCRGNRLSGEMNKRAESELDHQSLTHVKDFTGQPGYLVHIRTGKTVSWRQIAFEKPEPLSITNKGGEQNVLSSV